jgi:uncharacterized membrane protein
MALDTFTLIASQYALEEDALDDYEAVRAAYEDLGVIDTYDAAVVTKDPKGKVKIVKKVEEPTRQGALGGLAAGLAVGALVALFRPWRSVRALRWEEPRELRSARRQVTSLPG